MNGNPSSSTYGINVSQGWGWGVNKYFPINGSKTIYYGNDWSTKTKTYVTITNTYLDSYEGTLEGSGDVLNN